MRVMKIPSFREGTNFKFFFFSPLLARPLVETRVTPFNESEMKLGNQSSDREALEL